MDTSCSQRIWTYSKWILPLIFWFKFQEENNCFTSHSQKKKLQKPSWGWINILLIRGHGKREKILLHRVNFKSKFYVIFIGIFYFIFITLFYCKTCVFKTCLNQPLNKLKTYLNQPLNKLKFCVSKTSHLVRLLEIFINLTCLKQTPGLKFCSHKSHVFDIDRFHCVIENRLFGKMLNFLMHC